MGDVINLRTARKARARTAKSDAATANRAAFGRTKAEKRDATDSAARRDALLDGAKREVPDQAAGSKRQVGSTKPRPTL